MLIMQRHVYFFHLFIFSLILLDEIIGRVGCNTDKSLYFEVAFDKQVVIDESLPCPCSRTLTLKFPKAGYQTVKMDCSTPTKRKSVSNNVRVSLLSFE